MNFQFLVVAAFIGGLFAVPIFSVVRQALGVMVPAEQRRTAYALDSMGGEITFMMGPAASVMLATTTHTVVGLGTSLGAGLVLAGTNVGMVAVMREHDRVGELGIVFIFWCGASIVGGILYGALRRPVNPLWLLMAMAILIIPMGFATNAWTLGLLSILPGLMCAPVLTSSA